MRYAVTFQKTPRDYSTSTQYFRTFASAKVFYRKMKAANRNPMFHKYNQKDHAYDNILFDEGWSDNILKEIYDTKALWDHLNTCKEWRK